MIIGFTILNSFQHVLQTSLIKKTIRKLHLFSQMLFTLKKKITKKMRVKLTRQIKQSSHQLEIFRGIFRTL